MTEEMACAHQISPDVDQYISFSLFHPPNAQCKTDDNMMPKAHEKTFEWFNYTKSTFVAGPHYSGNTQGYLYPSESFDNIVIPNYKCAMDKECIQPEGSSLSNHRYDQTSLSIVSYQYHVMAQPHTEFLAASNPQTDFRQPAEKLIWTARSGSNNYFSSGY